VVSDARPLAFVLPREHRGERIATLFERHFELVWRTVRRLGVPAAGIDDAVQEVFVVATRRLDAIEPGKEKAFLYGTAVRVAADARRAASRRGPTDDLALDALIDAAPSPEQLVEHKRARELLDAIIERLPEDAREVFVLHELEGLTTAEISAALDIPAGTVASRLRRARELFTGAIARLEARGARHG
jgi:RNA polymerase sigma-70 factor, ECF subfamily